MVDKDKKVAIEAVYKALMIPVASRIYAIGMGWRELDLKETQRRRRENDRKMSFQEWRKQQEGIV